MRRGAALALVITALAAPFVVAPFPTRVETLYSRAFYPAVAGGVARATGALPFPVAEPGACLLLVAALVGLARAWQGAAGRRARLLGRLILRFVVAAAGTYLLFLAVWGFNYRRLPFAATGDLDVRPVAVAELSALAEALVVDSNALRAGRREDGQGVFRAEPDVLERAVRGSATLRPTYAALAGPTPRPKAALLSPLLSRVGIAGIYIPFTAEPLVNGLLPQAELPFSASHEIAHAQGFAREDEANFVGYLACRGHGDPDFRYSGTLVASFYVMSALAGSDAAAARALEDLRSEAVRRDVAAILAWNARYAGALRDAGEKVNDAYLRSQGAREGVRSYGRMVDLLVAERRPRAGRVLGSAP